jgi:hypothetical protein
MRHVMSVMSALLFAVAASGCSDSIGPTAIAGTWRHFTVAGSSLQMTLSLKRAIAIPSTLLIRLAVPLVEAISQARPAWQYCQPLPHPSAIPERTSSSSRADALCPAGVSKCRERT